jgi:hypothetical protein
MKATRELTKTENAFVEAMSFYADIMTEATTEFLIMEDDDFSKNSKHSSWYTQLADSYNIFYSAIAFERKRCINICEQMGDEGLDGHYCADEIAKGEK